MVPARFTAKFELWCLARDRQLFVWGHWMIDRNSALRSAFEHLQEAMNLLDQSDASPHIAAHVDLAANKLEELIKTSKQPITQIR